MNETKPSLVVCGTLRREVRKLMKGQLLNPAKLLFAPPGLHEWPAMLEEQVSPLLDKARAESSKVVVAYGEKCFIDVSDPRRDMDALLRERGKEYRRIQAKNCVDMLASAEERDAIAAGEKVYWLTPGWIDHWKFIFRFWDEGKANEMFPAYDKAVVLDGVGRFDGLAEENPEKILAISDWMKIPLESHLVTLDRFARLLFDAAA